jgi:hypothetical protein
MGFALRAVRKSVRRATPRPVRKAMHPARTVRNAATPRPVEQVSRAAYTVRHPAGATENAMIGAALYPPRRRRRHKARFGIGGVILGLVMLAVFPWWVPVLVILAAFVIPIIASRRTRRGVPPHLAPPVAGPPAPHWPPVPPVQPPVWQPTVQQAPVQQRQKVEPWPAQQGFRTSPPARAGLPEVSGASLSGHPELDIRHQVGLGDGSRRRKKPKAD